jgi:hypothetical protein
VRAPRVLVAAAAILVLAPASVRAAVPAGEAPIEVTVEKVKPNKPKHATLRFLHENKDFLRARLDLLRQSARAGEAGSGTLDPRYLAYGRMMTDALAATDSVARAQDARDRQTLIAHVEELTALERELDAMDGVLADQRGRLAELEADFAGRQQTALAILLRGAPPGGAPSELTITLEDSTIVRVALSDAQRTALAEGGIAQVYHGFVEPRAQTIEVAIARAAAAVAEASWFTLEPARDRLTFLELDLAGLDAADPSARVRASAWPLAPGAPVSERVPAER